MNKQYYQEYYQLERTHWWFQVRMNILKNQVRSYINNCSNPNTPKRILNIGAATGATSDMLSEYGEVVSVEYDKDCHQFLVEELNMPAIRASILDLPFDSNSFDIVCAFDVIEHVEDDQLAVNEMIRVCKAHGCVFVTVPAFMFLWSHHDVVNHHHRRYTAKKLINLIPISSRRHLKFVSYFNTFLFLPIYMARTLSRLLPQKKREDSGSDFSMINQDSFVNRIFYKIFSLENFFMVRNIRFPFGVSIFLAWQKP